MYRSPDCARAGARARSLPAAPCEHPGFPSDTECVLFVFINVHPTPIVRCAAMYLGRPPPDGECRELRSVGVMVAAMDLSRLFRGQKTDFSIHFTSSNASQLPLFSFLASRQPAFPSTHTHQTRRTFLLPITQAVLTGPGVERYPKPGCWAARVRM